MPNVVFAAMPLGTSVDILATSDPDADKEEETDTPMYEKHDKMLHGANRGKG